MIDESFNLVAESQVDVIRLKKLPIAIPQKVKQEVPGEVRAIQMVIDSLEKIDEIPR